LENLRSESVQYNKVDTAIFGTNLNENQIPTTIKGEANGKLKSILYAGVSLLSSQLLVSRFSSANAQSLSGPIVILGSGGKTGKLILYQLISQNIPVRPTFRNIASVKLPNALYVETPVAADVTNLGGIMGYKLQGENAMRELYNDPAATALSYIIIRPGGLLDGEAVGASRIELNQGDTISGSC